MPARPCNHSGCRNKTLDPSGLCHLHQDLAGASQSDRARPLLALVPNAGGAVPTTQQATDMGVSYQKALRNVAFAFNNTSLNTAPGGLDVTVLAKDSQFDKLGYTVDTYRVRATELHDPAEIASLDDVEELIDAGYSMDPLLSGMDDTTGKLSIIMQGPDNEMVEFTFGVTMQA